MDDFLSLLVICIFAGMAIYVIRFFAKNLKLIIMLLLVFCISEVFLDEYSLYEKGHLDIMEIRDQTCVRFLPDESSDNPGWGCFPSYLAK